MRTVSIGNLSLSNGLPLVLIAGPCVLESRVHAFEMATALKKICAQKKIGLIYKTSFDKANRTSLDSPRGMGMAESLAILAELRESLKLPVLTDVHETSQCVPAAEAVDVLQIPAFLCRQTDLILAAAATGKVVNIKKGQFLSPGDVPNLVKKATSTGNHQLLLTERGVSFGYNTLVTDMRAIPQMTATGYPVVFDATHSVQQPGGQGTRSGGQREYVPVLARAAISLGIAAVFIETHQNPDAAPSDGPNMVALKNMPALLDDLMAFDQLAKLRSIPDMRIT